MLYAVYDEDGRIYQSIKVYDQPNYDQLLKEYDYKFAKMQHPGLLSADGWHINTRTEGFVKRPRMQVALDKTRIKAGGSESAVFRNIPKDAKITVSALNEIIHEGFWETDELEISIPIPITYTIMIERWPYQTFRRNIEAYA